MAGQKSWKQLGGICESEFGFLWGIFFAGLFKGQFAGLSPAALAPQKAPRKEPSGGISFLASFDLKRQDEKNSLENYQPQWVVFSPVVPFLLFFKPKNAKRKTPLGEGGGVDQSVLQCDTVCCSVLFSV